MNVYEVEADGPLIGDVSAHVERSDASRDVVRDSARGPNLRFVPDVGALAGV